jgi:hypothetical protein
VTDGSGITRRRWRAPQQEGGVLHDPPLHEIGETAERNRSAFRSAAVVIDGRPLQELRIEARAAAAVSAKRFLQSQLLLDSRDAQRTIEGASSESDERLWFLCGHQPLLAHPGVWIKNIAVAVAAEVHEGVGLNLIVDHDIISSRSVPIPAGDWETPALGSLPFDAPSVARPGEDSRINDLSMFEAFGQTLTDRIEAAWGYRPMVGELWPAAAEVGRRSGRLVDALTRVRVDLEGRHRLHNLECPMSALAESEVFLHFVRHFASHADAFRESHNRRLAEYRQINGIRSRSHPVPDLARYGEWCEAPFWFWRADDVHRKHVFVRRRGDRLELGDGSSPFAEVSDTGSLDSLRALASEGVRLRPRALMTTMFARLFLADVFIHGIGGAKYDELTDAIGKDILGVSMPRFLTLTATRRLPLGPDDVKAENEWLAIQRQLRAARFNAEQLLHDRAPQAMVAEKQRLIEELNVIRASESVPRGTKKTLGRRLRSIEDELARQAASLIDPLRRELAEVERRMAANRVLRHREFPAVLHPLESYVEWIDQVRTATTTG